jgi:hypothetical protein
MDTRCMLVDFPPLRHTGGECEPVHTSRGENNASFKLEPRPQIRRDPMEHSMRSLLPSLLSGLAVCRTAGVGTTCATPTKGPRSSVLG